jgi:hypothetical protein
MNEVRLAEVFSDIDMLGTRQVVIWWLIFKCKKFYHIYEYLSWEFINNGPITGASQNKGNTWEIHKIYFIMG